jgi:uncharacterized protein (UPF0335 family)
MMSADENLRAEQQTGGSPDVQGAIKALIERIERHEEDGRDIQAASDKLGLDAKAIKTIRKAKADALAAQRTLEGLLAGGLITPAVAAKVAPKTAPKAKP